MTGQEEPKSERFNMFISKSETEAIDEWAWENRVRSKSEAVRRLVQIGLISDNPTMIASGAITDMYEKARLLINDLVEARNKATNSNDGVLAEALQTAIDSAIPLFEDLEVAQVLLTSTANQIAEIGTGDQTMADGLLAVQQWRDAAAKHLRNVKRRQTRRK